MGTVQKKYKKQIRKPLSPEAKLEKDLKQCMRCKYFWGNDSRCIRSKCYKEEKKLEVEKPKSECDDCPYKQGEGYCFPCMKKILGK